MSLDKSILCPILIGRAPMVGVLERALEAARTGLGGVLLIAGEAGIGKSRLTAELKARAIQRFPDAWAGAASRPPRQV